jgi:hypothetical protein
VISALRWTGLLLVAGSLSAGCDRRVEPFVPIEAEPPAPAGPVRVPGLETPVPRATSAPPVPRSAPDGPSIRGTIRLGSGVNDAGSGVLFVIARPAAGGPPLAAKRLSVGPFPLPFEIGPADAMMVGRPLSGDISLSARVDRDGDPLTRGPDDLSATLAAPVQAGDSDVELVLEP